MANCLTSRAASLYHVPWFLAYNGSMKLVLHREPAAFLSKTRSALRANEARNNLMLGVSLRLEEDVNYYGSSPFMATVEEHQLIAAALMTPPYNLIVFCAQQACKHAWDLLAAGLDESEWHPPGVLGETKHARAFAGSWEQCTAESHNSVMKQRVFALHEVVQTVKAPGFLRPAKMADLSLLHSWSCAFGTEALAGLQPQPAIEQTRERIQSGAYYLWENQKPVSMAALARPVGKGISIGAVYTPPTERRRGYASALVAELSRRMLDSEYEYCTLFTDLSNPTSNAIYQRIGYQPVCDYEMLRFVGGTS